MKAGILPRKVRKTVHCSRTVHIYDNVEDYLPIHRQKNEEQGESASFLQPEATSIVECIHLICCPIVQGCICGR